MRRSSHESAPSEFCEVAAMSMELISSEHFAGFYSPADVRRARRAHFEAILASFPWLAAVDAFQHWFTRIPPKRGPNRPDAWSALVERFGCLVDWTGCDRVRANLWHDVRGHIFHCPFYFVEYGIACLGTLQLWSKWKSRKGALAAYTRGLVLGSSRLTVQCFAAAKQVSVDLGEFSKPVPMLG